MCLPRALRRQPMPPLFYAIPGAAQRIPGRNRMLDSVRSCACTIAPRSSADLPSQFSTARTCRKALPCRDNLNRMRCRRRAGARPLRIESRVAAMGERFLAGFTRPCCRVSRCKIAPQRRIRRAKPPGAPRGGGYRPECRILDTLLPRAGGGSAAPFRARQVLLICRLRLAPASGISARNGDVAEWLKAAVC